MRRKWVDDLASTAWLAGCDHRDMAVLINTLPSGLAYSWWMNDFANAFADCCRRKTEGIKMVGIGWDKRHA